MPGVERSGWDVIALRSWPSSPRSRALRAGADRERRRHAGSELFRSGPETVRYGPADPSYGNDEIVAFRRSQPIAALPRRLPSHPVTTFGTTSAWSTREFAPFDSDAAGVSHRPGCVPGRDGGSSAAHVPWSWTLLRSEACHVVCGPAVGKPPARPTRGRHPAPHGHRNHGSLPAQ